MVRLNMCSTHCVPTSESFQWYGREIRRVTEIDYLHMSFPNNHVISSVGLLLVQTSLTLTAECYN